MASNRAKENEPVPPTIRKKVLERDNHRCQVGDEAGPEAGGVARLEVHHKDPNREEDRHNLSNLITLCQECHRWIHKKPTADDVPMTLSEDDTEWLEAHDYQIVQGLVENGPMTTGEVGEAIDLDLSAQAIRERLWRLMGLDDRVETRETQLIDQDVKTGRWGLPEDIAHSERGRIPPSIEVLIQRIEDERVRDAVDRGVDRQVIADTCDIAKRATYYRENRARAYQFPLNELSSNRGRPTRVAPDERNAIPLDHVAQLRLTPIDPVQSSEPDCSSGGDSSTGDSHTDLCDDLSQDGPDGHDHVTAE